MIQIIDNFLPPAYFQQLTKLTTGNTFPWAFRNGVESDSDNDYFFTNQIMNFEDGITSDYWGQFYPLEVLIEEKLNFKVDKLLRIKCNLYTNQNKNLAHTPHTDFSFPHYTALFYVNTNNGPTTINNEVVESVANRLVFFDGLLTHNSNLQTDTNSRINININITGNFNE